MSSGPGILTVRRRAGVLLPLASVPGRLAGAFGPEGRRILDWLQAAGMSWWQILPPTPLGAGDSPYGGASAFALEPLHLSLEDLAAEGLLPRPRPHHAPPAGGPLDYPALRHAREPLLRRAFQEWQAAGGGRSSAFRRFQQEEHSWLRDWCRFRVLDRRHRGPWTTWPAPLRRREPRALAALDREFGAELEYEAFLQFQLHRQGRRMSREAHRRGLRILGDLPLFVVHHSADVWARPELFQLDREGRPRFLTGVPPDYFSSRGQLWGHPHYAWAAHRREGFAWWKERFRRSRVLADAMRLDHFIGFHRVWKVPAGAADARRGRWSRSPGRELLEALRADLGRLPCLAEDLGAVVPAVHRLREHFGLPGMRVLQFGFGGDEHHALHRIPEDAAVYPGTHDNDTVLGWARSAPAAERRRALAATGLGRGELERLPWALVAAAWASPAALALASFPDLLGLGREGRINRPGTARGNWRWRLARRQLSGTLCRRLRDLTEATRRVP